MAAVRPNLGRVLPGSSILFLCDMQEKFRQVAYFPQIVSVAARMLKVARLLGVPAVLTEQYPEGLGPTVPELGAEGLRPLAKTCFSMVPAVQQELDTRPQLRSVLLCGIETQACILVRPPAHPWVPPSSKGYPSLTPNPLSSWQDPLPDLGPSSLPGPLSASWSRGALGPCRNMGAPCPHLRLPHPRPPPRAPALVWG
uniref:Isochorismatase domain containing 2 n=1 Tax=Panthera leo TaxID=9689 RepID=A0A8C9DA79_PANLE